MKKRILSTVLAMSLMVGVLLPATSLANEKVETQKMNVTRIAGVDRYKTAVRASKETFKKGSKYVVIASGEVFIDALVGGSLTSQVDAPLLLVSKNSVSKDVIVELQRLKPEEIVILGGTGTISNNVENEIKKLNIKIERLAGKNRDGTANLINEKRWLIDSPGSQGSTDTIALIDGNNFADALTAGPFTGVMRRDNKEFYALMPYMKGSENTLDDSRIIFGGTNSVPSGKNELHRFAGKDRYGTAVEVAKAYKDILRKEIDTIVLVDGTEYPDALASASVSSMNNGAVLLTNPKTLSKETKDYIVGNKNIKNIIIVGGENSVSSTIEKELKDLNVEVIKPVEEIKPTEPTKETDVSKLTEVTKIAEK